jgi:pilus assembly protein CpaE
LLVKHSSGLAVLPAPDRYHSLHFSRDSVETLVEILRDDFAYVIVDAGSSRGHVHEALLETADVVYLVTQVSVPDLRNSHRFITEYFGANAPANKLEVILNRYASRSTEIDEGAITKALMRPAAWKIPNDYQTVRRAQNTGTPLALENSAVSRVLFDMARSACGQLEQKTRRKRFGLFG